MLTGARYRIAAKRPANIAERSTCCLVGGFTIDLLEEGVLQTPGPPGIVNRQPTMLRESRYRIAAKSPANNAERSTRYLVGGFTIDLLKEGVLQRPGPPGNVNRQPTMTESRKTRKPRPTHTPLIKNHLRPRPNKGPSIYVNQKEVWVVPFNSLRHATGP